MGDTLLTNLCAICHISTPKYKCPRCGTRTCSLACTKKHKAWSSCSGVRDATAYVPKKTLATPAGVDHDYNFISAIERSRERSERVLVGEKGIIGERELRRPVTVENVEYRYKDGKARRVLVKRTLGAGRGGGGGEGGGAGGGGGGADGAGWGDMTVRLRRFDIMAVRAPVGMSRRQENETRYFKRSKRIEWYVELFLVGGEGGVEKERVTMRIADDWKVSDAFLKNKATKLFGVSGAADAGLLNHEGNQSVPVPMPVTAASAPLHRTFSTQDATSGAWLPAATLCTQNFRTAAWFSKTHPDRPAGGGGGGGSASVSSDAVDSLKERLSFYLTRPATTSSAPTTLVPFDPSEKLHDVLAGTVVLEYPTIYVIEKRVGIPAGFVVGSKPKPKRREREEEGGGGRWGKRRRLEDGEVEGKGKGRMESEEESESGSESESDGETSSSSSSSSSSYEDQEEEEEEEVLEEMSLSEGEGDEGEADEDDELDLGEG